MVQSQKYCINTKPFNNKQSFELNFIFISLMCIHCMTWIRCTSGLPEIAHTIYANWLRIWARNHSQRLDHLEIVGQSHDRELARGTISRWTESWNCAQHM